MAQSSTE